MDGHAHEETRKRHYLRSALHFSETQHFMLCCSVRLPIWEDLVRGVNQTVGCGCAMRLCKVSLERAGGRGRQGRV